MPAVSSFRPFFPGNRIHNWFSSMPDLRPSESGRAAWRDEWYEVIFGHETATGRLYDVLLIALILLSVLCALLENVQSLRDAYGSH
jgi:hypothetical protein